MPLVMHRAKSEPLSPNSEDVSDEPCEKDERVRVPKAVRVQRVVGLM